MRKEGNRFRVETEVDLRKLAVFVKAGARRVEFVFGKERTEQVLAMLEMLAQELGTLRVELEGEHDIQVIVFGVAGAVGGAVIGGAIGGPAGACMGAAVGGVAGALVGGLTVRILRPLDGPDGILSLA